MKGVPAGPFGRTIIQLLLVALVGIVIYLPAYEASFHLDDSPSIRHNAAIRHLGDVKAVWDFWPTRFLTYLTLAVNFHFSGLSPFPYHLTNVLIHILNACLVYLLFRRLFRDGGAIPLIAALLFLAHPIQTEAVTYVIQRATSLAACFYLISVFFYLRFRAGDRPGISTGNRMLDYPLSLLFCFCALFTKECTVTLPLTLALLEWLAVRDPRPGRSRRLAYLLPFFLAVLVVPLTVVLNSENPYYNDTGQLEGLRNAGIVETEAPRPGQSHLRCLATQPRALVTYIRLAVLPVNQRPEYEYPKFSSFGELPVLVSLLGIASILVCAWFWRRRNPLAALGVFWFFCTLLPETGLVPILDMVVEHRLYLPVIGAVMVYSAVLSRAVRLRRALMIFSVLVIACFCVLTYRRNLVWRDPVTLWEDNAAKAGGKARVRGNLGKAYLDAGRYEESAAEFRRMIELDPTFTGAYNNLAVIYIDHLKDYEEAEKYIADSLELFPEYPLGYLNRGVICLNTRRIRPAIDAFRKVLELDPKNLLAHYNLAACYINIGEMDTAEEYLRQGISFWPEEPKFSVLLSRVYQQRGDFDEAEDCRRRAAYLESQRK